MVERNVELKWLFIPEQLLRVIRATQLQFSEVDIWKSFPDYMDSTEQQ